MFDFVTSLMSSGGSLMVLALMFAENVFPPIPSEVVMPFAGFLSARGDIMLVFAVLAGTTGSVLGALLWYYVGRWVGTDRLVEFAGRHGRWLTISPKEVRAADKWFDRYGWWAVFFGRMIPGVRTLISVPAGLAEMPLMPFLFFTTLGSLLWTGLLAGAGYLLESQYDKVQGWLNPISTGILVLAVLYYVYRLIRQPSR